MIKNGINPIVTLQHHDFPADLMKDPATDGWFNRDTIQHFVDFTDICFN